VLKNVFVATEMNMPESSSGHESMLLLYALVCAGAIILASIFCYQRSAENRSETPSKSETTDSEKCLENTLGAKKRSKKVELDMRSKTQSSTNSAERSIDAKQAFPGPSIANNQKETVSANYAFDNMSQACKTQKSSSLARGNATDDVVPIPSSDRHSTKRKRSNASLYNGTVKKLGERICIDGLQNKQYNMKVGVVLGFDNGTSRYVIKLEDKDDPIKVRGNVLYELCDPNPYNDLMRHNCRVMNKNLIEEVEGTMQILQDHRNKFPHEMYAGWLLYIFRQLCGFHATVIHKHEHLMKNALKLPISEGLKIDIQIQLALFGCGVGAESLRQLLQDSYGRHVPLLAALAFCVADADFYILAYRHIKAALFSRNYHHSFDEFIGFFLMELHFHLLSCGFIAEAKLIREDLKKKKHCGLELMLAEGDSHVRDGQYQIALQLFTEVETKFAEFYGCWAQNICDDRSQRTHEIYIRFPDV